MTDFQAQTKVTEHFDQASKRYASWYDLRNPEGHSFRIRKQRCLEALQKERVAPKEGSRSRAGTSTNGIPQATGPAIELDDELVLDVGCGPGTFVRDLLDKGYVVHGTDIASGMIGECRTRFADEEKARFDVASADRLPETNASADAITAMGVLEYLNDEGAVLQEFYRVLKPDGIAILTYPHYASPSRAWNRFTHLLVKPILFLLRPQRAGVKHREYRLKPTLDMVKQNGFIVTDVMFYNMKLGFRPLDSLFPSAIVGIAKRLERFCRTPILRRLGTGFIVVAKKVA